MSASVAKRKPANTGNDDADYWQSRADRMRLLAARHDEETRSHLMKIAAGCEALAARIRAASFANSDRD
jgi:hypothetical protein